MMKDPGGRILLEAVVLRDGGELLLMLAGSTPGCRAGASAVFRIGRAVEGAAESVRAAPVLSGGGGYEPIGCWPRVLAAANAWAARTFRPDLRVGADDAVYLGSLEEMASLDEYGYRFGR